MSNRRKTKPRRPDIVAKVFVDPDNYTMAAASLRTITACASCGGHAQPTGDGSLYIGHLAPTCPAITDPSKLLPPASA